jgi:CBS domain-containing protein
MKNWWSFVETLVDSDWPLWRKVATKVYEGRLTYIVLRYTMALRLMQTESIIPACADSNAAETFQTVEDELADFSTDYRVLLLSAMALAIGAIGAVVAWALIWLIAALTNLAFYHRLSAAPVLPQGHHITREYSNDPFELARVRDVMDTEVPSVPATMKLTELSDRIAEGEPNLSRRQGTLLLDEQKRLVGIITRGDIVRALRQKQAAELTVKEAGSTELVVAFPDEPLHAALRKMYNRDVGRLPVVARNQPSRVVGYLGRAAVLSARMRIHEEENVRQRG